MSSRIEQLIDEIDEFIEGCKFQPLSATKIVVNKEEMEEYLRELRLKTPDEIKRYQKIISNKDAILEDAQTKADALIADAQTKAQEARYTARDHAEGLRTGERDHQRCQQAGTGDPGFRYTGCQQHSSERDHLHR